MKVGDLVRAGKRRRIGFVTKAQDRHGDGSLWYFVRFTENGEGWWYHPSKLKVLSES